MKEIEITCPCCETRLLVDVRSSKVLRTARPQEVDETGKTVLDEGRWDSANTRVRERSGQGQDAFDDALRKEHSREGDLDALFDKAKEKLARKPPDPLA